MLRGPRRKSHFEVKNRNRSKLDLKLKIEAGQSSVHSDWLKPAINTNEKFTIFTLQIKTTTIWLNNLALLPLPAKSRWHSSGSNICRIKFYQVLRSEKRNWIMMRIFSPTTLDITH